MRILRIFKYERTNSTSCPTVEVFSRIFGSEERKY